MSSALIRKLANVAELSEDDRRALDGLSARSKLISANRDIIREGATPDNVHLVIEGWACRYKILKNGSRQITAYLIPGDFCDLHVTVLGKMDHAISALMPTKVAYISRGELAKLTRERPQLLQALWWATLVDEGVLRAWLVNVGRRDAFGRVANLMCEMYERMKSVGLVENGEFDLPLTQTEIADSVGLTPVHTNRVIQRLRKSKLIRLEEERLSIIDVEGLKSEAGFDPSYLHAHPIRLSRD